MFTRNEYQALAREVKADAKKAEQQLVEGLRTKAIKPEDFSIRRLCESLVPDGREYVETMDPRYGDGAFREAADVVSTANFVNISGQIVFSAVLEAYQSEAFVFSRLARTQPTQFNGERIPGIGGIGDQASVVDEGMPYPVSNLTEDWIDTPQTVKRGNIVPVTKEAVFFDRTGLVLRQAAAVGEFLGYNKEVRLIDAFVDENVTAHRYKWRGTTYANYQSTTPWINLSTGATLLDWSDLDAALLLFANMLDPNTGLPILMMADQLVVCPQLVATASYITRATQTGVLPGGYATSGTTSTSFGPNPTLGNGYGPASYQIVTSRILPTRMATDTSWFLGNIGKTITYFENWPITMSSQGANSEDDFNRDIVAKYKASERGAAYVENPRHTVKSTVA